MPPVPKNLIKENSITGTLENSETPILSDFQDILNQKTTHSEEEDRKTGTILCGFSKKYLERNPKSISRTDLSKTLPNHFL